MTQPRQAKAIADYIGALTLSGGDRDGEPFAVLPWERRFILGAFRTEGDAAPKLATLHPRRNPLSTRFGWSPILSVSVVDLSYISVSFSLHMGWTRNVSR